MCVARCATAPNTQHPTALACCVGYAVDNIIFAHTYPQHRIMCVCVFACSQATLQLMMTPTMTLPPGLATMTTVAAAVMVIALKVCHCDTVIGAGSEVIQFSATSCGREGHTLKPCIADDDGHSCFWCPRNIECTRTFGKEHRFAKGASMMSCRECDYDVCKKCYRDVAKDFDPSEFEHGESCHVMIAACSSSHKPSHNPPCHM